MSSLAHCLLGQAKSLSAPYLHLNFAYTKVGWKVNISFSVDDFDKWDVSTATPKEVCGLQRRL